MIYVAQDGTGDFFTIQDAIDSISHNKPETIYIKKGIYKEKLVIETPHLTFIGEVAKETIITFSDYAKKQWNESEIYQTFRTYTALIGANHLHFSNLTFKNEAGKGCAVGQAIALYVDGDCIQFHDCYFLAHQDTLFTGPLPPTPIIAGSFVGPREHAKRKVGRQYFNNCYIQGDIDFIFGSATAYFEKCILVSNPLEGNSYITAASTQQEEPYGYVFESCQLLSEAKAQTVFLGRPWREYAHVAFLNCYMGEHIHPLGWDDWGKVRAHETVQFVEYNSYGPGATLTQRASYAKIIDTKTYYTRDRVLKGWTPKG